MENWMARPAQSTGDNHMSLLESEPPPAPAPLQEQSVILSEQQLFKRIIKLTLLLGILVGCWLTLFGVMVYNDRFNPGLMINHLIVPPMLILFGFSLILRE